MFGRNKSQPATVRTATTTALRVTQRADGTLVWDEVEQTTAADPDDETYPTATRVRRLGSLTMAQQRAQSARTARR